jgi:hypothetical protein
VCSWNSSHILREQYGDLFSIGALRYVQVSFLLSPQKENLKKSQYIKCTNVFEIDIHSIGKYSTKRLYRYGVSPTEVTKVCRAQNVTKT